MRAYWHHLSYELRAGLRNPALLFMNVWLPLGFYLLFGLLLPRLNPFFTGLMVPAMVVFAVMSAGLLGIPNSLVGAREAGVFRTYRINGVPTMSVLTIPVVAITLQTAVVAAVIVVTAPVLFDAPLPTNWIGFWLVAVVGSFAIASLGVLVGAPRRGWRRGLRRQTGLSGWPRARGYLRPKRLDR